MVKWLHRAARSTAPWDGSGCGAGVAEAGAGPTHVRVFALDHDLLLDVARKPVTPSPTDEDCREFLPGACPCGSGKHLVEA